MRHLPVAALLGALALVSPLRAQEPASPASVTAVGGVAWIADEAVEGEGSMEVDLWAPLTAKTSLAGRFAARTTILGADGVTFAIRDVRYDGDLSVLRELANGFLLVGTGGVWGKEAVDAQGSAQAGLLGVGFMRGGGALDYRVELGAVVDEREIDADAWGRLRARWQHPRPGWKPGLDLDLRVLEGDDTDSDLTVGPFVAIPAGGLLVRISAAYLRHETPLGLGLEGAQIGVTFEDAEPGPLDGGRFAPRGDVFGRIGFGLGDGQRAGRLQIVATSPLFRERWRIAADVDGQALAGEDPGDLVYRYTVGMERFFTEERRWLAGAWFYHRSGHRLGEPGEPVTSWNVVEVGVESEGFRHGTRDPGALDMRLRAGYVLDSSFGEDRRWQARAAARWTLPFYAPGSAQGFVEGEVEEGDASVRQAAAGIGFGNGLELAVSWLDDPQRFVADSTALLGTATLRF